MNFSGHLLPTKHVKISNNKKGTNNIQKKYQETLKSTKVTKINKSTTKNQIEPKGTKKYQKRQKKAKTIEKCIELRENLKKKIGVVHSCYRRIRT